ncbi:hypothetical protein ASPCADRAFT_5225 [Aspergillus carbonarius ITEM 5010]|uniref:AT hook motif protein n=1 Tax=Aspergillus carbonarius (strain ITEM 5010) TaxID=602072 RepID=A0A1R3RN27_ASPC5|nr:hypothetical protein ASPCADRAFT_5225 [Aspergillus carbonarius ITEM 5010]
MPMVWNEAADAKLLVGILATTNAKLDMHALASYMGTGCTVSAVQHRIQRLKEKVVASTSTSTTTAAAAAADSTPNTPGDGTTGPATMTAPSTSSGPASVAPTPEKRKRGRPKKIKSAEGDEGVAAPTPAPARKTRAKRARAKKSEATETEDSSEDVLPDVTHAEALAAGEDRMESIGGSGEVQNEAPVKTEETDVADVVG